MPLSTDQKLNETSSEIVKALRDAFGTPSSIRPGHAKGNLLRGTFTPTKEAGQLSIATHFTNPSTPVIARFSDSTGNPHIADTDPSAGPRGLGLRFVLSDDGHRHTDLVGHSTPFFPARDGDGFLAMIRAIGDGTIGDLAKKEPAIAAFVGDPKPHPVSFATERFFFITAHKMIDRTGKETYVRFRIMPSAGYQTVPDDEVTQLGDSYLFDEIKQRVKSAPAEFKLFAQVAEQDDATNDATIHWPESRDLIDLGTITLDEVVPDEESRAEQKRLIFDAVPRVEGLAPSADPIFEWRSSVYLQSGRVRRGAAAA